jgi:hypothetical protein
MCIYKTWPFHSGIITFKYSYFMKKKEYFIIVGGAITLIFLVLSGRPGGLFRASLRCGFFGRKGPKRTKPCTSLAQLPANKKEMQPEFGVSVNSGS